MTKVMVLKEKAERSWILQEIWRWRYKFFICFFGAFLGVYIFFQTVNPYIYIAILNFLGYYIGIETMGYLRDRKSFDMYMSLPCNMKKIFLFKILLGTILSFIAVVLAFLICRYVSRDIIANESWQYVLSQKKIMGEYDYTSYFILNTLGFYLSFSCGIVGSAITFYISSGILFTIFTKCMFLPLMMYFTTYFCKVFDKYIAPIIKFERILGIFFVGDFAVLGSAVDEDMFDIPYWLVLIIIIINILIAMCSLGKVQPERAGKCFLSKVFTRGFLYYITLLFGSAGALISVEVCYKFIPSLVTMLIMEFIGYYLIKLIFRKDLDLKGIPWFLIICMIFTAGIAVISNVLKVGYVR